MPYNRKKYRLFYTLVMILMTTVFWLLLHYRSQLKFLSPEFRKLYFVVKLIEKYYVEEVNVTDVAEAGLHGLLRELNPPGLVENDDFPAEYTGDIGLVLYPRNGSPMVISTIPGSPADFAPIQTGDLLLEIDALATFHRPFYQIQMLLKGELNTSVKIKFYSAQFEKNYVVTLQRTEIQQPAILVAFMPDFKTGYLRPGILDESTGATMATQLAEMQSNGMQRLLLDLRQVSEGTLAGALEVLSLFLPPKQPVFQTVGLRKAFQKEYFTSGSGQPFTLPLVVLINHGTARWAEAVAGTLQDLDRAAIVGENSFGLADIYETYSLKDQTRFKIATRRLITASGRCPGRNIDSTSFWSELNSLAADSLRQQRGKFQTRNGRIVYAHEGITPDETIALNSALSLTLGCLLTEFLATDSGNSTEIDVLIRFKQHLAVQGIKLSGHAWKTQEPEIFRKICFSGTQSRKGLAQALIEATQSDPQIQRALVDFDSLVRSVTENSDNVTVAFQKKK